jgi:hypothetical protein
MKTQGNIVTISIGCFCVHRISNTLFLFHALSPRYGSGLILFSKKQGVSMTVSGKMGDNLNGGRGWGGIATC